MYVCLRDLSHPESAIKDSSSRLYAANHDKNCTLLLYISHEEMGKPSADTTITCLYAFMRYKAPQAYTDCTKYLNADERALSRLKAKCG